MAATKSKNRRKKRIKRIIWCALLAAAIVIFILARNMKNDQVTVPTVEVTNAVRGDLQEELSIEGTVGGEEVITICAPASGELGKVYLKTGDEVKKDEVIATYDLEKLEKSLYQAQLQNERTRISYENTLDHDAEGKGKVKEADVNLPVLKQQIADHEQYLKNLQQELINLQTKESNDQILLSYNLKKRQSQLQGLLASMLPGTEDYEKTQKELEGVQSQLEQLTLNQSLQQAKSAEMTELENKIEKEQETLADLREYQAKMQTQKSTGEATVLDKYGNRQLEIDMELTELAYQKMVEEAEAAKAGIISPVQGVITNCTLSDGIAVASGVQIVTIERTDAIKITAVASNYALERLKVGQKVDAVIGSNTYPGTVSHIDRYAQPGVVKGTMSVNFEVKLSEVDDKIFLGSNAKMAIYTNKAENALIVPSQAVRANKDGDFAYVVRDGVIVKVPITCGIITNGKAEVISGITESDVIVVDYEGFIEEGTSVLTRQATDLDF